MPYILYYSQVLVVRGTAQAVPHKQSSVDPEAEEGGGSPIPDGTQRPHVEGIGGIAVSVLYVHLAEVGANGGVAGHVERVGGIEELRGVEIAYDLKYDCVVGRGEAGGAQVLRPHQYHVSTINRD